MIWNELSIEQRNELIETYKSIKKQIQKLNSVKANKVKSGIIFTEQDEMNYKQSILELQDKLNNLDIYYLCDNCSKQFLLDRTKLGNLIKGNTKPLFCCIKCSGVYYSNKRHKETSLEHKQATNEKISNTLKLRYENLSQEDKDNRNAKIKEAYSKIPKEIISQRNKLSAVKAKQTKQLRYGNSVYNNRDKAKQTWIYKYNDIDNILHSQQHLSLETLKIIHNRELFKQFILDIPSEERNYKYIADSLGISDSYCNALVLNYHIDEEVHIKKYVSRPELEVRQFVQDIYKGDIISNTRTIIPPKELDIYIPDRKVAIEINGAYYHSVDRVGQNYHFNKSEECEKLGIRLIHIFDYEWENERQQPILKNIIKNALGINDNKIYARNTIIDVKPSKDLKPFFQQNNIQGFRGGKFAICLLDKNTKEILMSYIMGSCFFGKGKYQWEVIRGATKLGVTVVGGASKIWKYFINTYKPDNCVYYVDYNYFNGNSLPYLGLTYLTRQPGFKNFWFDHWKTHEKNVVKNREPNHHKEVVEAIKEGKGFEICNAGTKVYVWQNKSSN